MPVHTAIDAAQAFKESVELAELCMGLNASEDSLGAAVTQIWSARLEESSPTVH
jgi:hypothetical protein